MRLRSRLAPGYEVWGRSGLYGPLIAAAVGRSGACGWSYNWGSSSQADSRALEECQKQKGVDCKIIARK